MARSKQPSFVKGWGAFELFVADLHREAEVTVERGAKLVGKSGTNRNIDVLITQKTQFSEIRTICECKYWNKRVSQAAIDTLRNVMEDVNANKGAAFSTQGFQKGAIKVAQHHGIDLYLVRDLEDHEWGNPGRVVDFWLQAFSRAVVKLACRTRTIAGLPIPQPTGNTKFVQRGDVILLTELIGGPTAQAMRKVASKVGLLGEGEERKAVVSCSAEIELEDEIYFHDYPYAMVDFIKLDFLVRIDQTRIRIDRAEPFVGTAMVEKVAKGDRWIAAKRKSNAAMEVSQALQRSPSPDGLKNGEVLHHFVEEWYDSSDAKNFEHLRLDSLD